MEIIFTKIALSYNSEDTEMCAVNDGNMFFRPMAKDDLKHFKNIYSGIPSGLVDNLFAAMTDSNTVRPAALAIILEGIYRLETGLFGNSSFGASFAYSALQIRDGGDGNIFHRFQDPIMAHIHDAMLQFALAERNMRLTQEVLTTYGYNLTHFCDCGCSITRDGAGYIESPEYRAVNLVRSYAESIGAQVHHVSSIGDLPLQLTDMHQHEVAGYLRVWELLNSLPRQIFDGGVGLSEAFTFLSQMTGGNPHAQSQRCTNQHPSRPETSVESRL